MQKKSVLRKYNSTSIQLQVDENLIGDPGDVAKDLAKHFCKTDSHISPPLHPVLSLTLVLISGRDFQRPLQD